MPKKNTPPVAPAFGPQAATAERFLLGPRHLEEWLDEVGALGLSGHLPDRSGLTDLWRVGQKEYARLALSEAGVADNAAIRPLPKSMARHIAQLVELEGVRRTFDTVPVAFGLVPLDALIISQYSMTQAVVDRIAEAHPVPISPKRLVELCLPLKAPAASFRLAGRSEKEFTFVADAHDMRFLDAQVIEPVNVQQAPVMGHPQAVIALSVGFSANLLNTVRYNGRIALNNGHHRALALRAMGMTHAPCLIQPCASMEDLQQAASSEILNNADLYFDTPRPPLLRDFDNPLLAHSFAAPRMRRVVTIKLDVQRRLLAL
ncbi:hypothetical protein LPB72_21980 [Hydrogenophaga crassostreae]|uniref:ParB/Sulfiredoxin domain-containing protein n=1 Tax=Hydrogenophaga crassostreae TaxID=1763535 RepID=A0A167GCM6_9BURK|nr:hypothetical protein [Hydrogenophaga crassostreae]AOW15179.1 hypothetical protein LPB072_22595 [Hydrogenophaga crassostreae]OAD39268.1 hypothetical protein LPB72_21980 [Hydrogenophaga crassostreae]